MTQINFRRLNVDVVGSVYRYDDSDRITPLTNTDRTDMVTPNCLLKSHGVYNYIEPPQAGGTIYSALPAWREFARAGSLPVAKEMAGGFLVVTPTTTEDELRTLHSAALEGSLTFAQALADATASMQARPPEAAGHSPSRDSASLSTFAKSPRASARLHHPGTVQGTALSPIDAGREVLSRRNETLAAYRSLLEAAKTPGIDRADGLESVNQLLQLWLLVRAQTDAQPLLQHEAPRPLQLLGDLSTISDLPHFSDEASRILWRIVAGMPSQETRMPSRATRTDLLEQAVAVIVRSAKQDAAARPHFVAEEVLPVLQKEGLWGAFPRRLPPIITKEIQTGEITNAGTIDVVCAFKLMAFDEEQVLKAFAQSSAAPDVKARAEDVLNSRYPKS